MSLLSNDFILIFGVGAAVFVMSLLWIDKVLAFLYNKSLGNRQYILQKLESMFIENSEKKVTISMLLLSFGMGIVFFALLWPHIILASFVAIIVTIVGWQIPKWAVDSLYKRRSAKFVNQMVDGLTIMSNGVRSGLSITQSMERVVENMPPPISQEFNLVLSQVRLGLSVEEALNALGTRIPEPDVQMFVISINILKETGGDLAQTFSTIVETIRERQKIYNKIEAMTAQGKAQAAIMSSVPFVLLIVFWVVDPKFMAPMFSSALGLFLLMVVLGLVIFGSVVMRKIVTIKV